LAQRHRIGLELLADDAGNTGSQGLLADLAEHLGGDLGAEALNESRRDLASVDEPDNSPPFKGPMTLSESSRAKVNTS